ncbi:hypothetical protein [Streptomyces sp. NPDC001530]|uniref:hypothetical protein n=1 Tax=Streptomyces sp. NPDC001530 TaxID=3364582 RepID=UPI0036A69B06
MNGNDDNAQRQGPEGSAVPRAERWGREQTRAALGLAVWEIELAVGAGLLTRGRDRRFDPGEVQALLDDITAFRSRLAAEHRLNATEAADRLAISRQRFARVVEQTGLVPIAQEEVRKYGRILTVRTYRAADIDALAPYAVADRVLREAATTVGRSTAAQKAARTRALNKARAAGARTELEAARPAAQASPACILRYAGGLSLGRPDAPGFLRRFEDDDTVRALAGLTDDCRLTEDERDELISSVRERAALAYEAMAGPDEIRSLLGVEPDALIGRTEMVGLFAVRQDLADLASAPPQWLLVERAAVAAADAEAAARRARLAEERKVLESAERAARITDETVAELFGLPVDVVSALRPRGRREGRWHPQYVAELQAKPPVWLNSEAAARQEAARRQERRAHARRSRTTRREAWRRTWAEAMGVPIDQVPLQCGRPTPKAVRAARTNPPRWALP